MALRVRVLLLFAFPGLLHAQIQLLPLDYQATNGRISVIQQQKDTLTLPFWDDFSQSDGTPDTGKWYTGRHIFINNSLPVNPPTLNVATFDGVNEFGRAHAHNSSLSGAGDSLISQPINLAAVPKSKWSTVYFSFFWQLRGFGELPDANDSLSLYFLSRDSVWVLQKITSPDDYHFSLTGGLNNLQFDKDSIQAFRQVILPVSNDIFFHKGFSFKFVSHSSLSGLYDTWHVDYVYLNADRQANDTYHYDRAISGQPSGLLYPYLEMPGHQFLANPSRYSTTLHYAVSNLDNSYHPNECTFELINTASGVSTGLITQVSPRLLPGETGRKNQLVLPALDPLIDADSVVLESKITYLTGDKRLFETVTTANDTLFFPIDLRMNDTLTQRYTLHNYYAYDDGSAEFAAGINLYGGQLAVAFVVEEPDTLTDIMIHFPAMNPSSEGQALTLKVWEKLGSGYPLRTQEAKVKLAGRNEYQLFTLTTPVVVRDTFYIGYEQFTDNYLGIGFDRNQSAGTQAIYTNINRQWQQNNRVIGSLMVRPVFRYSEDYVLGEPGVTTSSFSLYPNPTSGWIYFNTPPSCYFITDMAGKRIFESQVPTREADLTFLESGMYLLGIVTNGHVQTYRMIKK